MDTLNLKIGVKDDGIPLASDEGIVIIVLSVVTWIPEYKESEKMELIMYPNPAKERVSIKLGELGLRKK